MHFAAIVITVAILSVGNKGCKMGLYRLIWFNSLGPVCFQTRRSRICKQLLFIQQARHLKGEVKN
jgi:hypothetical protein